MIHRKYFLHCCRCFIIVLAALANNTNATSNTTPCPVDSFKILATKIDANNLDSTLYYFEQSITEFSPQLDTACLIQFYISYAIGNGSKAKYHVVFNTLWKALLLADEANFKKEQFKVNKEIARFYGYLNRFEKSIEHFEVANKLYNPLIEAHHLSNQEASGFHFSQMIMYRRKGDLKIAKSYYDSVYLYTHVDSANNRNYYLEVEEGVLNFQDQQYEKALNLYNQTLIHFDTINPRYKGIVYKHIGDALYHLGQLEASEEAYQNSISSLEFHQSHLDFLPLAYEKSAALNFERGNYKKAYEMLKEMKELDYQFFDSRSEHNNYLLNVQDDFRNYKEAEQKRFRKQELVQLQERQSLLNTQRWLLAAGLILLSLFAFTYFRLQRGKIEIEQKLNQQLKEKNIQKEAFLKLIEKKNEELVTFSNIMSHDLKAPLRNISAFSDLIKKKLLDEFEPKEILEFNEFINTSASSMEVLIEDLLLYSKVNLEECQFSDVCMNELVQLVLSDFSYPINSGKAIINLQELPLITGSASLLKTVFHNIISNAIKYQPKGHPQHIATVDIYAKEEGQQQCIFIQDNGIGIKESDIDKLFQPFVRFHASSEYKGTGLGMSICDRIMKKHNGKIEVAQTSSEGTLIKLTFPKNT